MSVLQKLTEGVVQRNVQKEGEALLNKWEATGLLQGLNEGQQRQGMAVLLENQAKELLREASSMAAGDVEGFAAVAFPIVRRVFGGLIANDLVSVQPMSLPSGLIFFLDFTHSDTQGAQAAGGSLYGGGVVGKDITEGVADIRETGFYGLGGSYANAHSGSTHTLSACTDVAQVTDPEQDSTLDYDPDLLGATVLRFKPNASELGSPNLALVDPRAGGKGMSFKDTDDADDAFAGVGITAIVRIAQETRKDGGTVICVPGDILFSIATKTDSTDNIFGMGNGANQKTGVAVLRPIRRHTKLSSNVGAEGLRVVSSLDSFVWELKSVHKDASSLVGANDGAVLASHKAQTAAAVAADLTTANSQTIEADELAAVIAALKLMEVKYSLPVRDDINSSGLGSVIAGAMPLEEASNVAGASAASGASDPKNKIAEIDIKVDSVAVTAQTKKLKAKWSPELGQDLNAYHNLDAEVELTGILSEQIALEIDRELLGELVDGATAGTRYWSRAPGLFVNSAGTEIGASSAAPDFTGTVSEWYETLIETINDVSAQIHRKTLRGGANFVVCGPEVANILEFTSGFRASVTADQDRGTIGAVKSGSLSKKFDVYVDPYFLRNVLLVGRKGSSFLESGFVYAPYVPLQVTPTIFGTEDFVPRKGVMTRYAKKMVRPDMYGLVIVRGLLGEAGAKA
ncbi:MAG: hypothetical protein CL431_10685 [Acidimicrobiaceae bacterium]|nr:hypothetical protein [Acidimicrobiaceae bacterium]